MNASTKASTSSRRYSTWRSRGAIRKAWFAQAGVVNGGVVPTDSFGSPVEAWSEGIMRGRRELFAAMARLAPHLSNCRGNGRTCACWLLSLGMDAFSRRGLGRRQSRARFIWVILEGLLLGGIYWWAFIRFADDAARMTHVSAPLANLAANLLIGVAGGFSVACLQTVYAVITEIGGQSAAYMSTVGTHPDGAFRLIPLFFGPWRRRIRVSRLRRELAILGELRRWEDRQWASRFHATHAHAARGATGLGRPFREFTAAAGVGIARGSFQVACRLADKATMWKSLRVRW